MKQILLVLSIAAAFAQSRSVAITIDDLPVAQSGPRACDFDALTKLTENLLRPIQQNRIPVTAFVIGGGCPDLTAAQRKAVIAQWLAAGAGIGNHSFSHRPIEQIGLAEYTVDILRAEPIIKAATGGLPLRYFRSPMLHTGTDVAAKRGLETFLKEHGYQQSPVTFDNSDWMFAYVYAGALDGHDKALAKRVRAAYVPYMESVVAFFEKRSVEVVGREFPQVLLMHSNRLNAVALPELLGMLRKRGYRFISLAEAMRDEAYALPNEYAAKGGISWIHRWSMTKGLPNKGEPDEPEWLTKEYQRLKK